jgi:hypothetical protein
VATDLIIKEVNSSAHRCSTPMTSCPAPMT